MKDMEKVFDAFRNCITEPKCRDCPWEQCEQFNQKKVFIPVTLALDVLNLLKKQIPKTPPEFWDCPSCGTSISTWNNPIIHYCYYCGQAVKWND